MTTLNEAIDRFIKIKRATGRAKSTITWYEGLLNIMATHFDGIPLESISDDDMVDYVVDCRERMSPDGADSYVRAFKAFWTWAAKRYFIPDPMEEISYPKARKTPVQPMKIDIFMKLFETAYHRDKALLLMMLATAGRVSEILQMTTDNIDHIRRRVQIKGKGAKYRWLAWDAHTDKYLSKWLSLRPRKTNAVWCNLNTGEPLTTNGVYQALRYIAKRADIHDRVHPHAIRHLSATMKAAAGMAPEVLRRKLGHENGKTTQRYMQIDDNELDRQDLLYSPVDMIFSEE